MHAVQRTWLVLEEKKIPYQWTEVNPYKKDRAYLAKNPKGLVPTLMHKGANISESAVIMEYLEDISGPEVALHPKDPTQRAIGRMMMDHIAKKIVAVFFRLQQAQVRLLDKVRE